MSGSRLVVLLVGLMAWLTPHAIALGQRDLDGIAVPAHQSGNARTHQANWPASRRSAGFEVNAGQFDRRADFAARHRNATIYLSSGDATLSLHPPVRETSSTGHQRESVVLRLTFAGRNERARGEPLEPLGARVNHFRGSDSRGWRSGIPIYSRVKYHDVYPGIDVVYYFDDSGQLEFDMVVDPGADPTDVRFYIEGAPEQTIDRSGNLVLRLASTPVVLRTPRIYQQAGGGGRPIQGRYVIAKSGEVGFSVEDYDRRKPMWIDPAFDYSTYLGGSDSDEATAIAADESGNAYVTGSSWSTDFPTAAPWQPENEGGRDAFVTKFDATGTLQYSTYVGGDSQDWGRGIAVDAGGNVYVTGSTSFSTFVDSNFPVTTGAFRTTGVSRETFVVKLDRNGVLVGSTLLGGSAEDDGFGVAVDTAGDPYVTGATRSADFPTATPRQPALGGQEDAFVTKMSADLTRLEYSTFLGGARLDRGQAVAVDRAGNASVAGSTTSTDFPAVNAVRASLTGAQDPFVAKLDSAGSTLLFSTYFGGEGPGFGVSEEATAVAVDVRGNTFVAGFTDSTDLPVMRAFQSSISGPPNPINGSFQDDGFIAVFGTAGALLSSTYLGGNGADRVNAIAADDVGNIFATGFTRSSNFPMAGASPSGMADVGAYRSTDAGGEWRPIGTATGLSSPSLSALAIDPTASHLIYAGSDGDGVFKSTDGGESWQRASDGLSSLFIRALAIDPRAPSTVYVATTGGGVNKSVDGGATWMPVNTGLLIPNVISLTIDPDNPSTLYAGTLMRGAARLYKTVNGGATWVPILYYEINAAAIDPGTSATVYAASHVLLFKSLDGGSTWTQIFREPQSTFWFTSLLVDPLLPSTIYAGTDGNGIFKSTDGGATWQAASTGLTVSARRVTSLALDPNHPSTLYAGTYEAGVFKSIDGAGTWLASNTGASQAAVVQLGIDPRTSSKIYAATDGLRGDAFISILGADGGLHFSSYAGGTGTDFGTGLAAQTSGQRVHVTGYTLSHDWPTSSGATQPTFGRGYMDAFVASLVCPLPLTMSAASADPPMLWPPDHRMQQASLQYLTSGGCGPIACSLSVVSNEPFNGTGDGDTEPDFRVVDARTVELRAERSPVDSGRIYTLLVACSDSTGQLAERAVDVTVPAMPK